MKNFAGLKVEGKF